jgi:hypothetical protein
MTRGSYLNTNKHKKVTINEDVGKRTLHTDHGNIN